MFSNSLTAVLTVVVDGARVVTVWVEGGVVVVDAVLESPGSHILNVQNVGSVILIDSGPINFFMKKIKFQ